MKKSSQGKEWRTCGRGTSYRDYSQLIKTGDKWTKADGSYGSDLFNSDGSGSGNDLLNTGGTNVLRFGPSITKDMLVPDFDKATRTLVLDLGPSTGSGQVRDRIDIGTVDNPAIQQMQFAVLCGRTKFEAANDTEGRMAA